MMLQGPIQYLLSLWSKNHSRRDDLLRFWLKNIYSWFPLGDLLDEVPKSILSVIAVDTDEQEQLQAGKFREQLPQIFSVPCPNSPDLTEVSLCSASLKLSDWVSLLWEFLVELTTHDEAVAQLDVVPSAALIYFFVSLVIMKQFFFVNVFTFFSLVKRKEYRFLLELYETFV